MRRFGMLGALVFMAASAGAQQTITANFDDVATSGAGCASGQLPDGYAGFTWSNWTIGNGTSWSACFNDTGFTTGTVSGTNFATPSYPNGGTISRATPFTLASGYFTAGNQDGFGIIVTGYRDGAVVFTSTVPELYTTPTFHVFDSAPVTSVVFVQNQPNGFNFPVIDNLTFTDATTTPEPASVALLGTGLLCIAPVCRKRRRTS